MTQSPHSSDDLPEPLRSLIEDIKKSPVPQALTFPPKPRLASLSPQKPVRSKRSHAVVAVVGIVLAVYLAAFIRLPSSSEPQRPMAKVARSEPTTQKESIPPPTLWAYREVAGSTEDLDELLTQHAAVLLPPGSEEIHRPLFQLR
ncbi:MAG: hypothetical protein KDA84_23430 [Planctomycetaceae bacterium]|nr:hypothetical protein [Planctomycetaceae bacterium]